MSDQFRAENAEILELAMEGVPSTPQPSHIHNHPNVTFTPETFSMFYNPGFFPCPLYNGQGLDGGLQITQGISGIGYGVAAPNDDQLSENAFNEDETAVKGPQMASTIRLPAGYASADVQNMLGKLQFQDGDEAAEFLRSAPKPPHERYDETIPTTPEQKRMWVALLVHAMMNMNGVRDNPTMLQRWKKIMVEDVVLIESKAWSLLVRSLLPFLITARA